MGATHEAVVCAQRMMRPSMHVALLLFVSVSAYEIPGTFTAKGGQYVNKKLSRPRIMRRYSSGYTSASGYSSAVPSAAPTARPTTAPSAAPTSAPTSLPMTPTVIVQKVTFAFAASAYTGSLKTLCELGYATQSGMYDSYKKVWKQGFTASMLTSKAGSRRASTVVSFTLEIPDASLATAVKSKTTSMTAATLNTAIANVKSADTATFGSVSTPASTGVAKPVVTDPVIIISGATGTTITSMWAAVVVGAVVLFRH